MSTISFDAISSRVASSGELLRLTPFDTSTDEGRSKERYRRMLLTSLSGFLARGANMAVLLLTVPLTIGYLGKERYGVWMTLSSLVAMLNFADVGMGNSLLNAVSAAYGRQDWDDARKSISNGLLVLVVVPTILAAAFVCAWPFVDWGKVFNVTDAHNALEAKWATLVFVLAFLATIPLGLVKQVQSALQQGFANNLWQAGGAILSLAAVLAAVKLRGGVVGLVFAAAGVPLVVNLANHLYLFHRQMPQLRPTPIRDRDRRKISQLFSTGLLFLLVQISVSLAFQLMPIIVAHRLGTAAVADYSIAWRLQMVVLVPWQLLTSGLWPALGEAMSRGDWLWVRRSYLRATGGGLLYGLVTGLVVVLFGQRLVAVWTKGYVQLSQIALLSLGAWVVVCAANQATWALLNASGKIAIQILFAALFGCAAAFGAWAMCPSLGVAGALLGTVVGYLVGQQLPCAVQACSILRSMPVRGIYANSKAG